MQPSEVKILCVINRVVKNSANINKTKTKTSNRHKPDNKNIRFLAQLFLIGRNYNTFKKNRKFSLVVENEELLHYSL